MANEVLREPNTDFVVSVYQGDQTKQTLVDMTERAQPFITQLRTEGKPVLMLINTRDVKNQDSGARAAAISSINSLDYDKMAIFGANTFLKHVLSFIMQLAIKKEKVQYFDTEEAARTWLTQ